MSALSLNERIYALNTDYPFHFIVLGAGGTGSELIPKLCRQLSFKRFSDGRQIHNVTLCDGDKVEDKNIVRQNFFTSDIGKNKAETMAIKCGTVFNLIINVFDSYIEDISNLENIINMFPNCVPFIIGCVDNNATRQMVHKLFSSWRKRNPLFYLDCGNEEFSGQVALGVKSSAHKDMFVKDVSCVGGFYTHYNFNLPDIMTHYPDMLEETDKFASQISCAERAVSNPQAYDTNIEAACSAYQMISNCLRGSIDYHKITFNVLKGNSTTTFNTKSNLLKYGSSRISDQSLLKEESDFIKTKYHEDTELITKFLKYQESMSKFYGDSTDDLRDPTEDLAPESVEETTGGSFKIPDLSLEDIINHGVAGNSVTNHADEEARIEALCEEAAMEEYAREAAAWEAAMENVDWEDPAREAVPF